MAVLVSGGSRHALTENAGPLSGLARKFAYVFRAGAGLVHAAGERTCRSSSRRIRSRRSLRVNFHSNGLAASS